jgi:hypothetical protein
VDYAVKHKLLEFKRSGNFFDFIQRKLFLSIKDFELSIEDSHLETRTIRRHKLLRDHFLENYHNFDAKTISTYLLQYQSYSPKLMSVAFQELGFEVTPPFQLQGIQERLFAFMSETDKCSCGTQLRFFEYFNGYGLKLLVYDFSVSIRDLPSRLISCSFLNLEGKFIKGVLVTTD